MVTDFGATIVRAILKDQCVPDYYTSNLSQSRLDHDVKLYTIYREAINRFPPVANYRQLDQVTQDKKWDLFASGSFLYLRPLKNLLAIPALTFYFDFTYSIPEFRLRLILFLHDESQRLASVGYRFETPEGEGRHDFFHAQPIRSLTATGSTLPGVAPWLPDVSPAFPLDAKDPASLLVSLLVGIYGSEFLLDLYRGGQGGYLKGHLRDKMHLVTPWNRSYWRVVVGAGDPQVYRTMDAASEFKAKIKRNLGKRSKPQFERISYSDFAKAEDRDQHVI